MSTADWPTAGLDRIARLEVLAAGLPGAVLRQRRFDEPFDRVWGVLADLERSVPAFDADVRRLEVLGRDGDHLRIRVQSSWRLAGVPIRFDVVLTDGWCLMTARPRCYVVGMAAEPDGDGTRFAHLEGVTVPSPPWCRPLVAPLLAVARWRHRWHVASDLDGMARELRRR